MALSFQVALITGASSGIGRELAVQLAARCRCLLLVARRVDRLEALAATLRGTHPGLEVEVDGCDLSRVEEINALVQRLRARGRQVDLLVNNAGLGDIGLFEACPPDKLEQMLMVNVVAPTLLTRALLPAMIAGGRGAILQISSGFGLTWLPGAAAYAGTKHHISAWSEALRCELRGTGVRLTQVCPGPVATEFEAVAGNPTGLAVPSFIELDAASCARQAIAALDADRALVMPGFWAGLGVRLARWSPLFLLRAFGSSLAGLARRRLPHVEAAGGRGAGAENGT